MELLIMFVLASSALYFFVRTIMLAKEIVELKEFIASEIRASYFPDDEAKESFLKFVSDSREWAFDYIEEVQNGLNAFIKEVDHEIDHFDNYGDAISTPLNSSMQKISLAYKELKKLMPEENND